MSSKNSESHISPVIILPNPSSMDNFPEMPEFKSCHNSNDNIGDLVFFSAHSRDQKELILKPRNHQSSLLQVKQTERECDKEDGDDKFYSINNKQMHQQQLQNELNKFSSEEMKKSTLIQNLQTKSKDKLGQTTSAPIELQPILTFQKTKSKHSKKKSSTKRSKDNTLSLNQLNINQRGEKIIPTKSQNWEQSSIQSHTSNNAFTNSPSLKLTEQSSFSSIQSLEMRTQEIINIENIIEKDFINVIDEPSESKNGQFQVFIQPQNTKPEENFCWVILDIKYSDYYPQTMPDQILLSSNALKFPKLSKKGKPLSGKVIEDMNLKANQLAHDLIQQRQVVVFEIIEYVKELIISQAKNIQYATMNEFHQELSKSLSGKHPELSSNSDSESSSGQEESSSSSTDQSNCKSEESKTVKSKKNNMSRQNSIYRQYNDKLISEGQDQIHEMQWVKNNQIIRDQLLKTKNPLLLQLESGEHHDEDLDSQMMVVQKQFSRYKTDFQETQKIGEGGAGRVYLARHNIDQNIYAIKKVRLYRKDHQENERIKREVTVLSRLHNQHIVRYFQAWIERIEDPQEIKDLNFSDEEDYYEDYIGERTSENDTYNNESELSSVREMSSKQKRANSYDQSQSYDQDIDEEIKDEIEDYYDEEDLDRYSDDNFYDDPHSYVNRQGKGLKKSKKDKVEKMSYFEKNYHKVNKIAHNNSKRNNNQYVPQISSKKYKENQFSNVMDFKPLYKRNEGIEVLYIQMEYCEGSNLRQYIKSIADIPNPEANKQVTEQKWKIFAQIVDALHYLHGIGLIHRDLKPPNIFLDKNNNVKLGDFGLATQHHCTTNSLMITSFGKSKRQLSMNNKFQVKSKVSQRTNCHSVGIGTPFYMAPEQKMGNTGEYNNLADVYSLGLIFYEMWVGHHFTNFIQMERAFSLIREKNEIDAQYLGIIPKEAQLLILWMVQENPEDRPSTTALLQSEQMPQLIEDGTFKKFLYSINKHSSIESLQLMNFLMKRQTPIYIDLGYEGYITQQSIQFQQLKEERDEQRNEQEHQTIIKSRIKKEFRKVFVMHGALDLEIPMMTPLQDSASILIFKRQNIVPPFIDRKKSHNSQEGAMMSSADLKTSKTRSMTGDLAVAASIQDAHQVDIDYVKAKFYKDSMMPQDRKTNAALQGLNNHLKNNNLQKLTYHHIEAPSQLAFRILDDTGIVLHLQMNLQTNFARYIARKPNQFVKRYHLGKVFRKNQTSQQYMQKSKAQEIMEASFDIISPTDELIYEAEIIKVCDQIAQYYQKEIGPYRIKISSTEIIDGILDECQVPFEKRHLILKQLSNFENKNWKELKKNLVEYISQQNLDRLGDFLQIRGSLQQVEQKLIELKGLMKQPDRFKQVIDRFKSMRNYLKYFSLIEIDVNHKDQLSAFVFDFGLILDNHLQYYSGLIFKLVLPNISHHIFHDDLTSKQANIGQYGQSNLGQIRTSDIVKLQTGSIEKPSFNKMQSSKQFQLPKYKNLNIGGEWTAKNQMTGVTQDFSELQISNILSNQPPLTKLQSYQQSSKRQFIPRFETLAVGGRFDNIIAHYQPSELPMACGVRFFTFKFVQKVFAYEQRFCKESQQTETKPFDVYIVSHGDMTKEKMELLSDFWKSGIRADADFDNNFGKTENQHTQNQSLMQKARFLITLKRQVYIGNSKMKVKDFCDFKNEKDREEHRDAIVDYIRQKMNANK